MSKAKRKYEYRPGREHSIPVEELAEEFDRMRAIEGKDPSPRMIVDYARDPDSRLHGEFTWDDSVAGEKFRLQEARELANSYFIIVIAPTGEETPAMANYSIVQEDGERGYGDAFDHFKDPTFQESQLDALRRDLVRLISRYGPIDTCQPAVKAIRRIIAKYMEPVAQ